MVVYGGAAARKVHTRRSSAFTASAETCWDSVTWRSILGSDQPFYALQPQGLDGQRECLTSIPQMAERYIQEIRRIQPTDHIASVDIPSAVWLPTKWPSNWMLRESRLRCSHCSIPILEKWKREATSPSLMTLTAERAVELRSEEGKLRDDDASQASGAADSCRRRCATFGRLVRKRLENTTSNPYRGKVTLFRVREKSAGSLHDPYAIWWRWPRVGLSCERSAATISAC